MTTPARHWRAAPGGGTHGRRRHDRRRRRAHARDARRWHVRPAPDGGGPATAVCAWPRCASTASPMWSRSASPAAGISCDGVVPACGKRHVHGWPWDSVEPGAPRPHCRFLSPHDYYIPRRARKLLAHLDAGPRSPATTNAAAGVRPTWGRVTRHRLPPGHRRRVVLESRPRQYLSCVPACANSHA
jgi:hypothetical protein